MSKENRRAARKREGQKLNKNTNREQHATATNPARTGRPHGFTIAFTIIGTLVACVALYWNIAQPDIRYVPQLTPETLTIVESKFDSTGNFVHSVRMRPKFTNFSFKPGFIDKVEFVPQSIGTLPDIKVTGIEKRLIFWHQERNIELTFLMSIPTEPADHFNTTRELVIDQVLAAFDNTGKKVEFLPNGQYGRIRFNFKQAVNIQLKTEAK